MANQNDPQDPMQGQNDQTQDRRNSINQWYNQYGGRNATEAEQNQWLGSGNFGTVEDSIRNSFANQPPPQQQQGTFDRQRFVNEWMGGNHGHSTADLANFVNQNQSGFGAGVQVIPGGKGDRIRLPDGSIIDAVIGAGNGTNAAGWTGDPSQMGGGGYMTNTGPGGPAGNGGPLAGGQDQRWTDLYDQLMKRAGQSLQVNPNDPIIKGQVDAYSAQQDRARRNYLSELAESNGPYASGAQLGAATQTAESVGQNVGNFQSTLMGKELDSRRQEIQAALTQAGGMLTDQQRLALQKELGYLNDATQRFGISTNATTAANRLGLDYANSQADYWLRSQGL